MKLLYNIGIFLYGLGIHLMAITNDKAKSWKLGRQYIFAALRMQIKKHDRIIWVHCASYGEFEQGKPLIERIRRDHPEYKVLLTFFSPSGYKHFCNYDKADYIFYLPLDRPYNAKRFLDIVHPQYIFFIKYEYWFNYIREAYRRKIPFYVVSAIFRPDQYFFRFYGKWFLRQLRKITFLFVQNEDSRHLLQHHNIMQCEVYGDTRFDTVLETVREVPENEIVRRFSEGRRVIIAGSTWEPDEQILHKLLADTSYSMILTPHEVSPARIESIAQLFQDIESIKYSDAKARDKRDFSGIRLLVIDTVGLLKTLYQYAQVAYIGGGFGRGIHNTLEAATFGLPIIFGPKYGHFKEACDLVDWGGAFCVHNSKELKETFSNLTSDETLLQKTGQLCRNYVNWHTGISERILKRAIGAPSDAATETASVQ